MSAALAVIDMQRIFADPASPWAAPRFAEIVAPVTRLVGAFGDATVFTRFVSPVEPAGAWRAYYAAWPFALQPPEAPDYQLVAPFTGASTADAPTFGKWPELAARIGPADRLIVCGVSTECCVLSTVLAAADAGMPVSLVPEACAGADDRSHRQAVDLMAMFTPLVQIVTLDQAMAEA